MFDVSTMGELHKLNALLRTNNGGLPSRQEVRQKLVTRGDFQHPVSLAEPELRAFTGGRPVVAVDGSRLEYGSFYPYYVVFMKSLAKSTGAVQGEDSVCNSQVLTPIDPDLFAQVELYREQRQISVDEAYRNILKESLAQMEIRTALEAVKKFNPCLLILDGGFLLFDKFPEWQELCKQCEEEDIILVGVIEEIATAELGKWLNLVSTIRPRVYDREVLFGLFEPGEYIHFFSQYHIKKNYCTVFGRLASAPQACGFDFLPEQEEEVPATMNFLYTVTPHRGQGIPAWLQIVDTEVRIRKKEMDRLVNTFIDQDVYEKYFKANRDRRVY
ncbi:MAG: DNA double-strand break repair nuclease NurA [Syntrophomonadaceae bacterium]|jgi:hypothetical protein